MVCLGLREVHLKDGSKRCIISAVGRRVQGSVFVDQVWVDPKEIDRNDLHPGDQFRAFKDGGILKMDGMTVDVSWMSDML